MQELMKINPSSIEYQDAMQLHTQIITSGSVAADALVGMCQGLKKMRDSRQYTYLGYHDFDEYVVTACRMKSRQAYTYISTIERLGENVLQSNANLGITKLALLASVSEAKRDDIMENNDVEDMSTRALQALTDELTKAREQISLLEQNAELNACEQTTEIMKNERNGYSSVIKQLQTEKKEALDRLAEKEDAIAAAVKATAEKDAAIADAVKYTVNEWKEKLREEKGKAIAESEKDTEQQIAKARQDGITAGKEAAQKGLEAIEREKAEALARAQELEKKLSVSGNSETVLFQHLFGELQSDYNKLIACAGRIAEQAPEDGEKYKNAIRKMVLEILPCALPEVKE